MIIAISFWKLLLSKNDSGNIQKLDSKREKNQLMLILFFKSIFYVYKKNLHVLLSLIMQLEGMLFFMHNRTAISPQQHRP
jgi:hypothetical protein